MKRKGLYWCFSAVLLLVLLCVGTAPGRENPGQRAPLSSPTLTVQIEGLQLTLSWGSVDPVAGYNLFYAPYPDAAPVSMVDMGNKTVISGLLVEGSAFYVAIQSYDNAGNTAYSDIEHFTMAGLKHGTGNQDFTIEQGQMADPLFGFRAGSPDSNLLPVSIDYTQDMPDVSSQGNTGSCTAWAAAYYNKTYQEFKEEGWDKNQNRFSPMYLFSMQCRNYEQPWNIINAWETLNRYGCARWNTFPYDDLMAGDNSGADVEKSRYASMEIPEAALSEAKQFRAGEWTMFENLNQIKQALTAGPVILGINYYSNAVFDPGWPFSTETNYLPHDPQNDKMGHAILCIGYDDGKFGTGALKFINSWGKGWGDNGFSWIRYPDISSIITAAMNFKDVANSDKPDDPITGKPPAPTGVSASDNAGPFVDIVWNPVTTAQEFRIYRSMKDDPRTYELIGRTHEISYRDHPVAGKLFLYSVASMNDLGESEHFASDTPAKEYVDVGSASGATMARPVLLWISNDDEGRSNFSVSNIAAEATNMEILISTASAGPWDSFGWVKPEAFAIKWGDDSEFVGKKPYISIVVTSPDAGSEPSEPAQVGEAIVSSVSVAAIQTLTATPDGDSIMLSWTTDGGRVDYYEVWRYRADTDQGNDWTLLDHPESNSFDDTTALPGYSYFYAVFVTYQGTYGEPVITGEAVKIPLTGQTNLYLSQFSYYSGQLSNPVPFAVTVSNDGGTPINDYRIAVRAFDWDDLSDEPVMIFNASEVAGPGQLPLAPGNFHTLSISMEVPEQFQDGHWYNWVVMVDPENVIAEVYEDDNEVWSFDYWWMGENDPWDIWVDDWWDDDLWDDDWWDDDLWDDDLWDDDLWDDFAKTIALQRQKPEGSRIGNSRPFSKLRLKKSGSAEKSLKESAFDAAAGPVKYVKPEFCNDHAK